MQVQEKMRHIDVTIMGAGLDEIKQILLKNMPDAVISDDDTAVAWEETGLCRQIRTNKTPGKILQAYRERAGLSITQLSEKTGIKYTNISAMEHDGRAIGLSSARRIAKALGFDYTKLLV